MIYIVIFFVLFLTSLNEAKSNWLLSPIESDNRPYQKNANRRRAFYVCLIALILFSGFRGKSIGIDTADGYYAHYLHVAAGGELEWEEPAWRAVNKIAVTLNLGYPGVLTLSSMMTLLPIGYALLKKCRNPCYGLFIYYGLYMTLYSFNLMRQCIAIAWVFLGIYFFERKNYVSTALAVAVAVLFHTSAVLAGLIIVFSKWRLNYPSVFLLFVMSFFIGLVLNESAFSLLLGKYAHYLNNMNGYAGFRNHMLLPVIFTAMVDLFFLALFSLRANDKVTDIWHKTTVLGIVIMNLTMRLGQGTRVVLYFSQAQAVFLPSYVESLRSKQNRFTVKLLYFTFLFANFMRNLLSQTDSLIPYRFFWMDG